MTDSLIVIQTIIIIFLLIVIYHAEKTENMVTSPVDGRAYEVIEHMNDKHLAADKLAQINEWNLKFIKYLCEKPKKSMEYILGKRLSNNYDPNVLFENNPTDKHNTSYTEDKGRTLALCLREKETGNHNIHETNLIMFVNIHELSHIASLDFGHDHDMDFWPNFKVLLHAAEKMGGYIPVDYGKNTQNYCGLDINYNPYHDVHLRDAEP